MASGPITSWQIEGEKVETVTGFIFLGSKITGDSDYRHEIKRCLLLGRKAMTNLDNILKSRDITLRTKVRLAKDMVFPWVMYKCENWTIKAERWRLNAFELWCWRRLESPLGCREIQPVHLKGNQPWIFTGRTDAEASILWPSDGKSQLTGKDPDAGKDLRAGGEGDDRGRGGWMASPTRWTRVWANSGRQWRTRKPGVLQSMGSQRFGQDRVTEQQQSKVLTTDF